MQPFWRGSECDEGNSGYGVGRRTSHNPVAVALARDCAGRVGARLPCAVSPRLGPILMRVCRPFLPGGRAGNGRQGRNRRCALRAARRATSPRVPQRRAEAHATGPASTPAFSGQSAVLSRLFGLTRA